MSLIKFLLKYDMIEVIWVVSDSVMAAVAGDHNLKWAAL